MEGSPPQKTLLILEAYDITEVNVISNKKITSRYNISILMLFWFIIPLSDLRGSNYYTNVEKLLFLESSRKQGKYYRYKATN